MEVPVKVYRRRRNLLPRVARELAAGTAVGLMIFFFPMIRGVWVLPFMATALWVTADLWNRMLAFRKRDRQAIRVYPDRIAWVAENGKSCEARFEDVFDVEPTKGGHLLRSTQGVLRIDPRVEGHTDLRRRLDPRYGSPDVQGSDSWSGSRSFRFRSSPYTGFSISCVTSAVAFGAVGGALAGPQAPVLWAFAAALSILTIYAEFLVKRERIEVRDGTLLVYGWQGGIRQRVPIASIAGACVVYRPMGRMGIVDTDQGEVRFSMELEGAEELVREAERLGMLRLAKERAVGLTATPVDSTPRYLRAQG